MKLLYVLACLLASAEASRLPVCKPANKLCKSVSKKDAQSCRNLIAQRKLPITSCEAPGPTVSVFHDIYKTVKVTKTIQNPIVTKVVTKTITKTGKATTPPTVTVTSTSTRITQTTEVDTTVKTNVVVSTKSQTVWATSTATTSSTTTTTSMLPYELPACQTAKKKRDRASNASKLPEKCSCFLTATKGCGPASTKTITRQMPVVTKTSSVKAKTTKTTTRTRTATRFVDGPVVAAPETTKVVSTTLTQTERTLTTLFEEQVSTFTRVDTSTTITTSTKVITATAARTSSPCDNPSTWTFGEESFMLYSDVTELFSDPTLNTKACCEQCFGMADCLYFISNTGVCQIFSQISTADCISDQCPRGKRTMYFGEPDGNTYYMGKCAGGIGW